MFPVFGKPFPIFENLFSISGNSFPIIGKQFPFLSKTFPFHLEMLPTQMETFPIQMEMFLNQDFGNKCWSDYVVCHLLVPHTSHLPPTPPPTQTIHCGWMHRWIH